MAYEELIARLDSSDCIGCIDAAAAVRDLVAQLEERAKVWGRWGPALAFAKAEGDTLRSALQFLLTEVEYAIATGSIPDSWDKWDPPDSAITKARDAMKPK